MSNAQDELHPGGASGDRLAARGVENALADADSRDLLIRRYLLGRLQQDEVEAFEERFVRDRVLLDEIDATEGIIEGFRRLQQDGRLRQLVAEGSERRGFFADATSWLALGAAAALVVALIVAIDLHGEVRELRREVASLRGPQVNPQIIDLEITRGVAGKSAHAVRLPAEPTWIVLAMDTVAPDPQVRRARLVDAEERVVAEILGLTPDDLGVVYWMIHSGSLTPGRYSAELSGADARPEVRYELTVTGPD